MREIQVTQAKAHFAELLREVEHGKSFAITRHGRTVAHLFPPTRRTMRVDKRQWSNSAAAEQGGGVSMSQLKRYSRGDTKATAHVFSNEAERREESKKLSSMSCG